MQVGVRLEQPGSQIPGAGHGRVGTPVIFAAQQPPKSMRREWSIASSARRFWLPNAVLCHVGKFLGCMIVGTLYPPMRRGIARSEPLTGGFYEFFRLSRKSDYHQRGQCRSRRTAGEARETSELEFVPKTARIPWLGPARPVKEMKTATRSRVLRISTPWFMTPTTRRLGVQFTMWRLVRRVRTGEPQPTASKRPRKAYPLHALRTPFSCLTGA